MSGITIFRQEVRSVQKGNRVLKKQPWRAFERLLKRQKVCYRKAVVPFAELVKGEIVPLDKFTGKMHKEYRRGSLVSKFSDVFETVPVDEFDLMVVFAY